MFPITIDSKRISEKRDTRPVNPWDYVEYDGCWYPKRSYKELEKINFLKSCSEEFGKKFASTDEFQTWADEQCEFVEEHTCTRCDFKSNSLARLEVHTGSRNCICREKRLLAQKNGEIFILDSQKPKICKICNKSFRNKYCLATHLKTTAHINAEKNVTIPKHCVCGKAFSGDNLKIKFRRHLKQSKNCHKKVCKCDELCAKWLYLHHILKCKFPVAVILIKNDQIVKVV
jgi:hypothetical protein